MTQSSVLTSVDSAVGTVQLDRPAALNALDGATKDALLSALQEFSSDAAVRCVVITGSGRAFSVGQDLREHAGNLAGGDLEGLWATVPEHYNPIALTLHQMPKPVLAAVNGVAAGAGASLALLADLRVLAASASFHFSFAGIGLSADTGTTWMLPRLVGYAKAIELLYLPRAVPAIEALELGLATEVVEDDAFAERVRELAEQLAAGPTLSYAAIRESLGYGSGHPLADTLAVEAAMMRRTGSSADHARAVRSFLAKETPVFMGR